MRHSEGLEVSPKFAFFFVVSTWALPIIIGIPLIGLALLILLGCMCSAWDRRRIERFRRAEDTEASFVNSGYLTSTTDSDKLIRS